MLKIEFFILRVNCLTLCKTLWSLADLPVHNKTHRIPFLLLGFYTPLTSKYNPVTKVQSQLAPNVELPSLGGLSPMLIFPS